MKLFWNNRLEYLNKLSHKDCVMFALFCARQVEDGWKDVKECREAIETVERWLEGKATEKECKIAADAAAYAAADAAADAAYAAAATTGAYAAYAAAAYAAYAAYAAAAYASDAYADDDAIKEIQMNYLYELIYIDEILEERVLRVWGCFGITV
jgi:hypothetical protein